MIYSVEKMGYIDEKTGELLDNTPTKEKITSMQEEIKKKLKAGASPRGLYTEGYNYDLICLALGVTSFNTNKGDSNE